MLEPRPTDSVALHDPFQGNQIDTLTMDRMHWMDLPLHSRLASILCWVLQEIDKYYYPYITEPNPLTISMSVAPNATRPFCDPLQVNDVCIQNGCFLGLRQQRHAFLQHLWTKSVQNVDERRFSLRQSQRPDQQLNFPENNHSHFPWICPAIA